MGSSGKNNGHVKYLRLYFLRNCLHHTFRKKFGETCFFASISLAYSVSNSSTAGRHIDFSSILSALHTEIHIAQM